MRFMRKHWMKAKKGNEAMYTTTLLSGRLPRAMINW
jgi:hypothetical protein